MKLHLGALDIILVLVLVFAGILAHNWYNAHPNDNEYAFLKQFAHKGDIPKTPVSQGGGGTEGSGTWTAAE